MRLDDINESRIIQIPDGIKNQIANVARAIHGSNSAGSYDIETKQLTVSDHNNMFMVGPTRIIPVDGLRSEKRRMVGLSAKYQSDVPNLSNDVILVNPEESEQDLYDTILHEFVNLVDPQSEFVSQATSDMSNDDYYNSATEFNAFSTEFIERALNPVRRMRDLDGHSFRAHRYLERLTMLMKMPFEFGDWETFFGENTIPVLEIWVKNKKLWRVFKTRLWNAIQDELKIYKGDKSEGDFLKDADLEPNEQE